MIEGQGAITGIAETVAFKENMAIIHRLPPQHPEDGHHHQQQRHLPGHYQ